MKNAHTPGPWHVEPLVSTLGADMAICAPANGWVVAVIQHDPDIQTTDDPDGDTVVWHDADHANARLIAEAPAMLAALRAVAGELNHWGDDSLESFNLAAVLAQVNNTLDRIDGDAAAQAAQLRADALALDTGMDPALVRELHAEADRLEGGAA